MQPLRRFLTLIALAFLLTLPLFSYNAQQTLPPLSDETLLQLALAASGLRDDATVHKQATIPLGKWLTLNDHTIWLSSGDHLSPETPVYVVVLEGYPKRSLLNIEATREVRAIAINTLTGTTFYMSLLASVDDALPTLYGEGVMSETELFSKAEAWIRKLDAVGEPSGVWLPLTEWRRIAPVKLEQENRPVFVVSIKDYTLVLDGKTGELLEAWGYFVDLAPSSDLAYPALGYSLFLMESTSEPQPFPDSTSTPVPSPPTPQAALSTDLLTAKASTILDAAGLLHDDQLIFSITLPMNEWDYTCTLPVSYERPHDSVFGMVLSEDETHRVLTLDAATGQLISLLTVYGDLRPENYCRFRDITPTPALPTPFPLPLTATHRASVSERTVVTVTPTKTR